jgi:DNA invertase Pin-like site-specific DNA recombinase
MIYGYAHASTASQDLDNQVARIKAAGCGAIFREKMTGTTPIDRSSRSSLRSWPPATW